jgi:hypothetical protein
MPDPYTFLPKRLIREARRTLRVHGVNPTGENWLRAIRWCEQVSHSYEYSASMSHNKRRRWPSPSELASMFLFYVWADLMPRLPYRATPRAGEQSIPPPAYQHTTAGILQAMAQERLAGPPLPQLEHHQDTTCCCPRTTGIPASATASSAGVGASTL